LRRLEVFIKKKLTFQNQLPSGDIPKTKSRIRLLKGFTHGVNDKTFEHADT